MSATNDLTVVNEVDEEAVKADKDALLEILTTQIANEKLVPQKKPRKTKANPDPVQPPDERVSLIDPDKMKKFQDILQKPFPLILHIYQTLKTFGQLLGLLSIDFYKPSKVKAKTAQYLVLKSTMENYKTVSSAVASKTRTMMEPEVWEGYNRRLFQELLNFAVEDTKGQNFDPILNYCFVVCHTINQDKIIDINGVEVNVREFTENCMIEHNGIIVEVSDMNTNQLMAILVNITTTLALK